MRLFSATTCICFQRRRVHHNANYVAYSQMTGRPLCSTIQSYTCTYGCKFDNSKRLSFAFVFSCDVCVCFQWRLVSHKKNSQCKLRRLLVRANARLSALLYTIGHLSFTQLLTSVIGIPISLYHFGISFCQQLCGLPVGRLPTG